MSMEVIRVLRDRTGAGMLDCKKALEENGNDIEKAIEWLKEKGIASAAKKQSRVAAEGLCNIAISGNTAVIFELNSETDFVSKNEKFAELLNTIGEALLASGASNDEEALKSTIDGKTVEQLLIEATTSIGEKISLRRVSKYVKNDSQTFGKYLHQKGKMAILTVIEGGNEEVAFNLALHVTSVDPTYLDESSIPAETIAELRTQYKEDALAEGKPEKIVDNIVEGKLKKYRSELCLVDQAYFSDKDITVDTYCKNNNTKPVYFIRLVVGEGIEKVVTDFAAEVAAQLNQN